MGREIRRVPADWQHPRDESGNYKPLYDQDYETAAREYLDACIAWDNDTDPDAEKYRAECPYYWDWNGGPPDRDDHRRRWSAEEATHFQIYETVSEGTPRSPVFASLDEMREWLVGEGYSREAAEGFTKSGYAPSMVWDGGRMLKDIEACAPDREADHD